MRPAVPESIVSLSLHRVESRRRGPNVIWVEGANCRCLPRTFPLGRCPVSLSAAHSHGRLTASQLARPHRAAALVQATGWAIGAACEIRALEAARVRGHRATAGVPDARSVRLGWRPPLSPYRGCPLTGEIDALIDLVQRAALAGKTGAQRLFSDRRPFRRGAGFQIPRHDDEMFSIAAPDAQHAETVRSSPCCPRSQLAHGSCPRLDRRRERWRVRRPSTRGLRTSRPIVTAPPPARSPRSGRQPRSVAAPAPAAAVRAPE